MSRVTITVRDGAALSLRRRAAAGAAAGAAVRVAPRAHCGNSSVGGSDKGERKGSPFWRGRNFIHLAYLRSPSLYHRHESGHSAGPQRAAESGPGPPHIKFRKRVQMDAVSSWLKNVFQGVGFLQPTVSLLLECTSKTIFLDSVVIFSAVRTEIHRLL
jgi:hypothetical protein